MVGKVVAGTMMEDLRVVTLYDRVRHLKDSVAGAVGFLSFHLLYNNK